MTEAVGALPVITAQSCRQILLFRLQGGRTAAQHSLSQWWGVRFWQPVGPQKHTAKHTNRAGFKLSRAVDDFFFKYKRKQQGPSRLLLKMFFGESEYVRPHPPRDTRLSNILCILSSEQLKMTRHASSELSIDFHLWTVPSATGLCLEHGQGRKSLFLCTKKSESPFKRPTINIYRVQSRSCCFDFHSLVRLFKVQAGRMTHWTQHFPSICSNSGHQTQLVLSCSAASTLPPSQSSNPLLMSSSTQLRVKLLVLGISTPIPVC